MANMKNMQNNMMKSVQKLNLFNTIAIEIPIAGACCKLRKVIINIEETAAKARLNDFMSDKFEKMNPIIVATT